MAVNIMEKRYCMVFVLMFLSGMLLSGCSGNALETGDTSSTVKGQSASERTVNIDRLEIYHFHGTHQCYSCITVGDYAEETVKTYFADELESGRIVFGHVNGELAENRDLVIKYGATGSSLWLGTYNDGVFKAEQNIKVWYKIGNKQDYKDYLRGVIEQKLAGD